MDTRTLGNRYGLRADVEYGASKPPYDTEWACHDWRVTLKLGRHRLTTDFYTGIGISGEPKAADVLDSLILDTTYADDSFEGFCADLGYDTDSRKAERIYKACQSSGRKLRRFLNSHYDEFMAADRL